MQNVERDRKIDLGKGLLATLCLALIAVSTLQSMAGETDTVSPNASTRMGMPGRPDLWSRPADHVQPELRENWVNLTNSERFVFNHEPAAQERFRVTRGEINTDSPEYRSWMAARNAEPRVKHRWTDDFKAMASDLHEQVLESLVQQTMDAPQVGAAELWKDAAKAALRKNNDHIDGLSGVPDSKIKLALDDVTDELVELAARATTEGSADLLEALHSLKDSVEYLRDNRVSGAIGRLVEALFADIAAVIESFRSEIEAALNATPTYELSDARSDVDKALHAANGRAAGGWRAFESDTSKERDAMARSPQLQRDFAAEVSAYADAQRTRLALEITTMMVPTAYTMLGLEEKRTHTLENTNIEPTAVYDVQLNNFGEGPTGRLPENRSSWIIMHALPKAHADAAIAERKQWTSTEFAHYNRIVKGPYTITETKEIGRIEYIGSNPR